ncbi:MAG TPA: RNA 2',3'-cyclic phosphodiesterase [Patescibacteria group bacterium]|nr:RNA 2',3'-cyclic phosphodiesterase [Patescibacteria group bacterium]
MKRKIFISINITDSIRKKLINITKKWQDLPVKWVKESNLHITLLFLGYVDEEIIPEICQKVRNITENVNIFDIEFDKIELFPSAKDPKMIVLTGPASNNLLELYDSLGKELEIFSVSKKSFHPHITLGRGRKYKWEAMKEKPSIEENYPLVITADAIDVMASDFGDGENEFTIIESCSLR